MTLRQLKTQIGELSGRTRKRLARLSIEQVEQLAEALLKFESKSDLNAWLKAHPPQLKRARKPATGRAAAKSV